MNERPKDLSEDGIKLAAEYLVWDILANKMFPGIKIDTSTEERAIHRFNFSVKDHNINDQLITLDVAGRLLVEKEFYGKNTHHYPRWDAFWGKKYTETQVQGIIALQNIYSKVAIEAITPIKRGGKLDEFTQKCMTILNSHINDEKSLLNIIMDTQEKSHKIKLEVIALLKKVGQFDDNGYEQYLLIQEAARKNQNSIFSKIPKDIVNLIQEKIIDVSTKHKK